MKNFYYMQSTEDHVLYFIWSLLLRISSFASKKLLRYAKLYCRLTLSLSKKIFLLLKILPEICWKLQSEVQFHEPKDALDGGNGSGLKCLEEICSKVHDYLMPGGFLALEMGGRISFFISNVCLNRRVKYKLLTFQIIGK